MCFLEHSISSERGNLIGRSVNSRHNIVWRDFKKVLFPWTSEISFSSGPVGHSEVDVDFEVYYRFVESRYWLRKLLCSCRYSKWGASIHWTSKGFKEWWRTIWCCSQVQEKYIRSIWSLRSLVWKVLKWFVISQLCGEQGGSLYAVIYVVYADDCLFWACS